MHTNLFVSQITPNREFLEDCPGLSEDCPDTFYLRAFKILTNEQLSTEET
jgi:hypothetical protein